MYLNYCIHNFCIDGTPAWRNSSVNSALSSITILGGSLKNNHTYQFGVYMINLRNSTIHATGYLLVKVDNTRPQMVAAA
jgi:hypothetical protein